jgi:hypothetical protein
VDVQHQIKRTLNQPAAIARIDGLLAQGDLPHRTALARQVCEQFGFYDGRGRAQLSGCLRALRELESAGHFALPEACTRPGTGGVKRLPEPVPPACDVPGRAGDVRGLQLVLVASDEQMRTWNELMLREHPQGAGPLVGAQLRYLIGSAHGWLGGFGFSSAALQLRDRDTWLGWDVPTRREQLHRVVNMSRFLLRDRGCHNLASRVMGEVLGRVADDFSSKYGYRPWLVESFVDTEVFEGTCYRASNWIEVGQTRGRGRQDRARRSDKHVKAIYLYPLVQDWRSRLGLAPAPAPLGIDEGLDGANWVELEFGGAPLGDRRLSRRLVDSARRQAEHPGRAFTGITVNLFSPSSYRTPAGIFRHFQIIKDQRGIKHEFAHFLGDTFHTFFAFDDADGEAAQARHVLRAVAFADAASILVIVPVEDVVAAVLDAPVLPVITQNFFGAGLFCCFAGDAISNNAALFACFFVAGQTFHFERLADMREVQVVV